jgi:NTE family protein
MRLSNLFKSASDKRIGLALGGGAVLGAAHLGVLKVLEENKIKIQAISGTSIGAFIAALYAFQKSIDDIIDTIKDLDWLDISELSLSRLGLLSNKKLGKKMDEVLGEVNFSDASIPLAMVATDISSGKKVALNKGDVAQAVMASTCVPGIFIPAELDGKLLVDGGLVENVPVSVLQDLGAEVIIGVDLNAKRQYQKPDDIIDLLMNSMDIAIDNATRIQTSKADFIIKPVLSSYSRTETDQIDELIEKGYNAAKDELKKL